MPFDKRLLALLDIRNNILLAQAFLDGLSLEEFTEDRRTFYAVTRALEIISESRRLPAEIRDRHADLPWRAIMGAGNVYRHDYNNVVEEYVWHTVHESLGQLPSVTNEEIEAYGEAASHGGDSD